MPPPKPKTVRMSTTRYFRMKPEHLTKRVEDPCVTAMSSVLACWASVGYSSAGCAEVEAALRLCMDTKQPEHRNASSFNYHLARFQNKIHGHRKINGAKD